MTSPSPTAMGRAESTPTTVRLPNDLLAQVEATIERGLFPSRSAAVAVLLSEALEQRQRILTAPGTARKGDRATSKAAACDVAPRAGSQRARCLRKIVEAGTHGATTDEVIAQLEQQLGTRLPVNGYARRVTDLLEVGAIAPHPAGATFPVVRETRNGSKAMVWVATDKGRAWLTLLESAEAADAR